MKLHMYEGFGLSYPVVEINAEYWKTRSVSIEVFGKEKN